MAEGRTKQVLLALRIAVVIGGIACGVVWIDRDVGWRNLADTVLSLNLAVFAGTVAMFTVSQLIVGLRWWLLLRTQHIFISAWAAVKLHFLGMFYNNFLPSAVGGDLVRAWYVTRHTDRGFEAVLSVFVDRVLGFTSMILLAAGSWMLFIDAANIQLTAQTQDASPGVFVEYKALWLSVLAGITVVVLLLFAVSKIRCVIIRLTAKLAEMTRHALRKSREAFVMYCRNPLTVLSVVGITMVSQSILITVFWLLGRSMGIDASIKYYFVFFPASWVLGALPLSVGGAVVVEGWLVYLFVQVAGADKDQALVLALCQRFVWMIASLPGAGIHLFGAHLPKRFSVDETSPEN